MILSASRSRSDPGYFMNFAMIVDKCKMKLRPPETISITINSSQFDSICLRYYCVYNYYTSTLSVVALIQLINKRGYNSGYSLI